jgi:VanZ family protein
LKKFLILWAPVFIYAGFIFYFSSLTSSDLPKIDKYDKVIHVFEFSVLGFLLSRAINPKRSIGFFRVFIVVNFINILYGISDEFHQLFVPGRVFSYTDIASDGFGGIIGNLIYQWRK